MESGEAHSKAEQGRAAEDLLADFFYRADEDPGELGELAADGGYDERPAEEPLREFLGFELAGEHYALELARIREIVRVLTITEVPRAPAEVLGVTSVRGEVIPVFDLRRRLRLPPLEGELGRRARVVIVDVGEGPVGMLVDAVEQVVRLRASLIETPPPGLSPGVEAEYLVGIGRVDERFYVLLNLETVLRSSARGGRR